VSVFRSRLFYQSTKSSNGIASNHDSAREMAEPEPASLITAVQERRLRKILETIEAEPLRNIFDLAQELNLSTSHLQHLFKQHTGCCLGRLLTEHRLRRAAQLLSDSNMSVKEIAHAVGYEHTSSFIRAFERRFMQPPRRYRETR